MNRFFRVFFIWFFAVGAAWTFANLPRNGGSLKLFLEWAGFPWTFAFWEWDHLRWFDSTALAADIVLGFGVAIGLGCVCAWSRCRLAERRATRHVRRDPSDTPSQ